jgi:nanoRNase/pAp phosphatase (c-di-AMP/oligoRNAs hydrolase)
VFDPTKQDGMMIFKYDGKHDEWRYGFYTEKEGIDLSPIAIKRGGGGHVKACGCETKDLLPELKKIMIK